MVLTVVLAVFVALLFYLHLLLHHRMPSKKPHRHAKNDDVEVHSISKPLPTTITDQGPATLSVPRQQDSMLRDIPQMVQDLVATTLGDYQMSSNEWTPLTTTTDPPLLVFKSARSGASKFRFKTHGVLPTSPDHLFCLLASIKSRSNWDHMVEVAEVLHEYSDGTRIIYLQLRAIFPTAARDLVLLSHRCQVEFAFPSDTKPRRILVNVSKSVEWQDAPEKEGVIRMHAGVTGQILFEPLVRLTNTQHGLVECSPKLMSIFGGEQCEIIQVADGDPMGWVPSSVVQYLAFNVVPKTFRNLMVLVQEEGYAERLGERLDLIPLMRLESIAATPLSIRTTLPSTLPRPKAIVSLIGIVPKNPSIPSLPRDADFHWLDFAMGMVVGVAGAAVVSALVMMRVKQVFS